MSKRTVIMATIVLKGTDFPTTETIARELRAVYQAHHGNNPTLVEWGSVSAYEVTAEAAHALETKLTRAAADAAARGAPTESSDPAMAGLLDHVRRSRMQ